MHIQETVVTAALSCLFLLLLNSLPEARAYALGQSKYGRIEKFPYQVMLIGKQLWRKRILCGGTLLDKRWILTAGHCTMGVTHFDIYLGAKSVEDTPESGRVMVRSNKFIVHEEFNPVTAANDIALVKLPDDVEFTARIQPAKLPHSFTRDSFTGSKVVATGWGGSGMSSADPMQFTELRVISNEKCSEEYDVITSGIVCAQGLQDETVCSGDSGGPLVLKGTQVIVGITSFGPADGCETNIPGGFTRVTHYLDWISDKIGHSSPPPAEVQMQAQESQQHQYQHHPQHQQQHQQQQHHQQHHQQQHHQQQHQQQQQNSQQRHRTGMSMDTENIV